jgi:hypothetical protein
MMRGKVQATFARLFVAVSSLVAASLVLFGQSVLADTVTPQVQIEVKIVTVSRNTARELGVDMRLADKLGKLPPDASNLTSPQAAIFGLGPSPSASVISQRLFPDNEPGNLKLSGLLSPAQSQILLDTFLVEKSAKIVSTPLVRTIPGQKTAIDVPSAIPIVGGMLRLEVTPRIGADGTSLEMTIVPQVQDIPKTPITTTVGFGEIPVLGGLFTKTPERKQNVLIFVTAQRVDALSPSPGGYKSGDPIKTETVGTGETIGRIADLKLQNLTGQPLVFIIPPLILESKSGKNQASACPYAQNVKLAANETKIVPLDGICLDQKKPAVGKGVTGELVMNTGDSTTQDPDLHIPADKVKEALHIETAIYEAVGELAKAGAFKNFPYPDKEQQKRIALQWCTWTNARLATITGGAPATKEDMKAVVKKQQPGPVTPATEKKIDKGVDTIWDGIELASAKAKDLEGAPAGGNTVQVSNDQPDQPGSTGTPPPVQFIPRDADGNLMWSKPIQAWVDKRRAAKKADANKTATQEKYNAAKKKFFDKSKHHTELEKTIREKQQQLTTSSDKEVNDKLIKERDEAKKELAKVEAEMEKDFKQTDDGKKLFVEMTDAQRAADKANTAEKEAGKFIDEDTKKSVEQMEDKPVKAKW